jgi:protein TonB
MSYLNHVHDPRRRATALVSVGAVHVLLAAGLVAGLAVNFERIAPGKLIGTNIPLPPPVPDPTPTPTAKPVETTYVPTDPPRAVELPTDTTVVREADETLPAKITYYPSGTVDPPALPPPPPRPSFTPRRAVPSNSSSNWITNNDSPRRALVDEAEGSASYRLVIGTNGRVSSCELTSPTGNRALDDATCRLITSRARFEPATDETGSKVMGIYAGSVRWDIPD